MANFRKLATRRLRFLWESARDDFSGLKAVVYGAWVVVPNLLSRPISCEIVGWLDQSWGCPVSIPLWITILASVLGLTGVVVWGALKRATNTEDRIRPRVEVSFEPTQPWVHRITGNVPNPHTGRVADAECIFVRVMVRNPSPSDAVLGCTATLLDILRQDDDGSLVPTIYSDTLALRWAAREPTTEFQPINIPPKSRVFIDLLSVDEVFNTILVKWPMNLISNSHIFDGAGTFVFVINVAANTGGTEEIKVGVKWTGQWDQIETWKEPD